ncbi:prevent-host-death family protein [Rhizobium leguminosarum]|uniref:Prevent-host-death family protein n=1 Tax=Rhizobium leguminosarum TaxID=384 RepID=A0A7K3VJ71_RHILE|nr:prevent-host-death family protein [Rhizobium leguminosarum]NEK17165.1 prevent-host-death family protein [Rhizobium leguminosarum]NEK35902.1 prevent-host-death family protein [Rhizobium leguminosarum]
MMIFADVEEAAERLEELVELALRQDEVYVCRDGRRGAMLTGLSRSDALVSDDNAQDLSQAGSRDRPDLTSIHDDLHDARGLAQ